MGRNGKHSLGIEKGIEEKRKEYCGTEGWTSNDSLKKKKMYDH